jgi:dipeptidyl aminopeptidase/acylaminoacyl peptidase
MRLEKSDTGAGWTEFLPGGEAVVFAGGVFNNPQLVAYSRETGVRRQLVPTGTQPRYAASGRLIYAQDGNLLAIPFDPDRLEVTGQAVPVVKGVVESAATGAAQYSLSSSGTLVYFPGGMQSTKSTMVWVDRKGIERAVSPEQQAYDTPRLSPDGKRIAMSIDGQIWLYDLSRDALTRFTFEGTMNNRPAWTPDGKRLAFYSNKSGPLNIFWEPADGSGAMERLTTSDYTHVPKSFSPDEKLLAYHEVNPTTGVDIWVLNLASHKAEPFLRTPSNEADARFSPDGRWMVYHSDESGRYEVYVQPYPGPAGRGRSQRRVERSPSGTRTEEKYFTEMGTR